MITNRSKPDEPASTVKTVAARTVQAAVHQYSKHPMIGLKFGPTLAITAVEVDTDDKFGLDLMHYITIESRERGGVLVNALGQACAAIKNMYGNVHIKATTKNRMLVLDFYARPWDPKASTAEEPKEAV